MPNIPSAAKRARQAEKRRAVNRAARSLIRTLRGRLFEAIDAGDKPKAESLLKQYTSTLARAARKGTIKDNTASRRTSRVAQRVAAMKPSA